MFDSLAFVFLTKDGERHNQAKAGEEEMLKRNIIFCNDRHNMFTRIGANAKVGDCEGSLTLKRFPLNRTIARTDNYLMIR